MCSVWTSKILALSPSAQQQIFDKYQQSGLSVDVRQHTSVWIENNILNHSMTSGSPPGLYDEITLICSGLIAEIMRVAANNLGNTNLYYSLRRSAEFYQTLHPSELYLKFKACLDEEKRVLSEQTNLEVTGGAHQQQQQRKSNPVVLFTRNIFLLTNETRRWRSEVDAMKSKLCHLQMWRGQRDTTGHQRLNPTEVLGNVDPRELQRIDQEMTQKIQQSEDEIIQLAGWIVTELGQNVEQLRRDFIPKLKWSESIPGLSSLDEVRGWYKDIQDIIDQLGFLRTLYLQRTSPVQIHQLLQPLDPISSFLKSNCLVVQEQPAHALKTESKFQVKVLCLSQEKMMVSSPNSSLPNMKVSLLNEEAASILFKTESPMSITRNEDTLKLINNEDRLKCSDESTAVLAAQFRKVIIKTIQAKGEKRNNAMAHKYCLLFTSTIDIDGRPHEVWCCSVPFVIYVHVNQKMQGWGTIFWDTYFRQVGRVPFVTPSKVRWFTMTSALRDCFKVVTGTSWTLTDPNLRYIGEKIVFQTTQFDDNTLISREKFFEKDTLTKICPWDRLYSIMELISKHLQKPWDAGYIVGFVDRQDAESNILPRAGPGSFLLRFSDTSLGGISISYNVINKYNQIEIASMKPFTETDLEFANLSDRLKSDQLLNVYHPGSQDQDAKLTAKWKAFPLKGDEVPDGGTENLITKKKDYVKPRWMLLFESPMSPLPHMLLPNSSLEDQKQPNYPDLDGLMMDDVLSLEEERNINFTNLY